MQDGSRGFNVTNLTIHKKMEIRLHGPRYVSSTNHNTIHTTFISHKFSGLLYKREGNKNNLDQEDANQYSAHNHMVVVEVEHSLMSPAIVVQK